MCAAGSRSTVTSHLTGTSTVRPGTGHGIATHKTSAAAAFALVLGVSALFCALTGIDKTSHSEGHDSQVVRDAIRKVDETAAHIRADAERDGRWDTMHLWIVSDHGHSPVRAHEDLAGLIASW